MIVDKEKAALYHSVFNTPNGRKVVDDLVSFVGFYGDQFTPGDPHTTAYNCGQKRVLTRILRFVGMGHPIDDSIDHTKRLNNG